jgi:DNA polymerase
MDLARAQLQWLIELGADEAIGEAPVDRYAASRPRRRSRSQPRPRP